MMMMWMKMTFVTKQIVRKWKSQISVGEFGKMKMTETTLTTSMMTVSMVDHDTMRIRGRGMTTMTTNRVAHGLMR